PRDGLTDPPRGIRRELIAAAILVLLDPAHEPRVPFLNQVEETEAAVAVLLGDRNDEPQIASRELLLGFGPDAESRLNRTLPLPQRLARLLSHEHQFVQFAFAAMQLLDVSAC